MEKAGRMMMITVLCMMNFAATFAQCSICTKTASQLGEEAGRGLNGGILYLAAAPMLIVGFIGYRWWKNNR